MCRHDSHPAGSTDDISSIYRSLRPGRSSSATITPETATPRRQELGACLVARQRSHVSRRRLLVATQPTDTRSFLCCRCVKFELFISGSLLSLL